MSVDISATAASWPDRRDRRADDVLAIQRAARKGGTRALLRWLARRTGAQILLTAPDGTLLCAGDGAARHTELAQRVAGQVGARALTTLSVVEQDVTVVAVGLNGATDGPGPVLTAVAAGPAPEHLPRLLADASSALDLCWREERAETQRLRLEVAEARNREAVLHLLMNGHVSTARQVAEVLGPELPEVIRYHVVATAPDLKPALARRCRGLRPDAWVIPCPVYDDHIAVLVPAEPGTPPDAPSTFAAAVTSATGECLVGVSDVVAIRDASVGYGQAVHALVTARTRAQRWAMFSHHPDPALVIGAPIRGWARQFLEPLRTHVPQRLQDPDSTELTVTANSWLGFASGATSLLKIHRNTLAARLRHIEQLLALDLDRLADQSLLALALRTETGPQITDAPSGTRADSMRSLDELLRRQAVADWALRLLRPLDDAPDAARTLAAWLRHDARLTPTAQELSLSLTAVRKRLARIEELLDRSLLRPPTDRHELWLARRALHLAHGTDG
ncbi:hypothetical protein ABH940_004912 [Streptacidiphilus sp. BW17]|uniref:helix-turn-helix domain-containing protein n=1 Tax=Streptacidiphilus sp. BW17 TaxID=3156274 RepID=UPI003517BE86